MEDLKHIRKIASERFDIIFHLAANADVRGGNINRDIDLEQNLLVTKSVCDYSVENSIKNFIFASFSTQPWHILKL